MNVLNDNGKKKRGNSTGARNKRGQKRGQRPAWRRADEETFHLHAGNIFAINKQPVLLKIWGWNLSHAQGENLE